MAPTKENKTKDKEASEQAAEGAAGSKQQEEETMDKAKRTAGAIAASAKMPATVGGKMHPQNGGGKMASTKWREQAKRHQKSKDRVGTTKPAIRRLARRAGVKRIGGSMYDKVKTELEEYTGKLLQAALNYTECGKRKTVMVIDVISAAKQQGTTYYTTAHL